MSNFIACNLTITVSYLLSFSIYLLSFFIHLLSLFCYVLSWLVYLLFVSAFISLSFLYEFYFLFSFYLLFISLLFLFILYIPFYPFYSFLSFIFLFFLFIPFYPFYSFLWTCLLGGSVCTISSYFCYMGVHDHVTQLLLYSPIIHIFILKSSTIGMVRLQNVGTWTDN